MVVVGALLFGRERRLHVGLGTYFSCGGGRERERERERELSHMGVPFIYSCNIKSINNMCSLNVVLH